jgi:hypothetical protein
MMSDLSSGLAKWPVTLTALSRKSVRGATYYKNPFRTIVPTPLSNINEKSYTAYALFRPSNSATPKHVTSKFLMW